MDKNDRIRIELTDDQRKQIKEVSGKDAKVLELTVRELEERIAPIKIIGNIKY